MPTLVPLNEAIVLCLGIEDVIVDNMIKVGDEWICNICNYKNNKKSNIQEHIEARHTVHPGYICSWCNRTFKTKASLRVHSYKCKS